MSDRLRSCLEGMKKKFWQEHRHLPQDDIKLRWTAYVTPYTNILLDTDVRTLPSGLTSSTPGQQIPCQSTTKSCAATRRRGSDTVPPVGLGQPYQDALSSEPMSRKRARTSQHGPGLSATTATSVPSLSTNLWQLDTNVPYCGYSNPSASGPTFKAKGRMPIKIPEPSPNIRVFEPAEYIQQSGAFPSSSFPSNVRPQSSFNGTCIPSSSLELPSPFSTSPTMTESERFTNTTPPTSAAMSREDSLPTSFCEAFGMVRASSGVSEMDLGQNMCRQDSYYGTHSNSFSPDAQGAGTPFDPSILFAHAEGTAIGTSSASTLPVEQLQLPPTLELSTEMKRDSSSSSVPTAREIQSPSPLDQDTKMIREGSSESNSSSTSRISRRSQEQIAQAARPIAPKDVAEGSTRKHSSSSLSGGQDMCRQRSAPEPKILIPKLHINRQTKEKLKCDRCNKNPDGYRGAHELQRHMALDHNSSRTAWVCVDISNNGFLSGCTACESEKPYGQDYNAAAHLRRFHFHPKSEVRRTNVDPEERRGGKGGGKDPPMSKCRQWMKKIQVPGKDYMTLPETAGDDAGDDVAEDDEESQEAQPVHAEVVGDPFLARNDQEDGEPAQLRDMAIDQHIPAFPVDSSDGLELVMANDRQITFQTSDMSFSRSEPQSAIETSPATYLDSNAESFIEPTVNLAYSQPTLSSSAPVAPSFLGNHLIELDHYANSTPNIPHSPSTMSTYSSTTHPLDISNFPISYLPDDVSYEMFSPSNPHIHYGLNDFHRYR